MGKEGFLHMGCKGMSNKFPEGKENWVKAVILLKCVRTFQQRYGLLEFSPGVSSALSKSTLRPLPILQPWEHFVILLLLQQQAAAAL